MHIQPLNDCDGQEGEGKVANDVECRVQVSQGDDDVDANAGAGLGRRIPEVGNRVALQHRDKEEDEAGQNVDEDGDIQCPPMQFRDDNPQQEGADGEFRQDHRPTIADVTVEPVLMSRQHDQFASGVSYYQVRFACRSLPS